MLLLCWPARSTASVLDLLSGAALKATLQRRAVEHVTWPGNAWRGDDPPDGPSPTKPQTWGEVAFSPEPLAGAPVLLDVGQVTVPASDRPVLVNGILAPDEWEDAVTLIHRYAAGAQFAVLLKHSGRNLLVGFAAPAELWVRDGMLAEVAWETGGTGAEVLGGTHHLARITMGRAGRSQVRSAVGREGAWWFSAPEDEPQPVVRAAAGHGGDGAWHYFAAEFALPLAALGGADNVLPPPLRMCAHLQLVGRGNPLALKSVTAREAVYWPDSRTSYSRTGRSLLGARPDLWTRVTLDPDHRIYPVVPRLSAPVKIDGQIGPDEWVGAGQLHYALPGGQWRTLLYGRDDGNLLLGVRWSFARGPRPNEACVLYVDPLGDGGLAPRGDDLLGSLTASQPQTVQVRRYREKHWQDVEDEGLTGAMARVNAFETQCEFAVLAADAQSRLVSPSLAVELSWDYPRP
jgi:hypothetical protein